MDKSVLDKLFPFHLKLSEKGSILYGGKSLIKIHKGKDVKGIPFFNIFSIKRPIGINNITELKNFQDSIVEINLIESNVILSGQAIWEEDYKVCTFYITPYINSLDILNTFNLSYDDFSIFDSSIDNLGIIQSHKSLLKEAQEKEGHLLEKNTELKKANQALDSFVYHVSHDLKSPVTNLSSMLKMLKKEITGIRSTRLNRIISNMDNSIDRFNKTIYDFLELTKVKKGKTGTKEVLEINSLIDSGLNQLKIEIEQSACTFNLNIKTKQITFPRAAFNTIFTNLISNAIKYRSPDRLLNINVSTIETKEYIKLSIKDNGIGIDLEEHREKVFDMFGRIEGKIDGTGVGLYMVKSLLEEFKGKIEVESELGIGSTFIVYFKK